MCVSSQGGSFFVLVASFVYVESAAQGGHPPLSFSGGVLRYPVWGVVFTARVIFVCHLY